MPGLSLAEFVEELQRAGELARVAVEVAAELEIAEITRRTTRRAGPALLFERVRGQRLPVATNLLGSQRRVCLALGIESLDQVDHRLWPTTATPGWLERIRGGGARTCEPRLVKSGACQQVVRLGSDIDLAELPALQCWAGESHSAITAGLLLWTNPHSGERHLSQRPLAILDRNRLGLHLDPHDPLEPLLAAFPQKAINLPVSVVLGGEPGYRCLPAIPLLASCDPWTLAGALLERTIELVKCRTHDQQVPVDAELVIEGTLDSTIPRHEGVVLAGDAGYCSVPIAVPVLKVTAITHRANPIFPAVVAGALPHEGIALGRLTERALLSQLNAVLPDVTDVALPAAGGCRSITFVALRKQVPHQARQVTGALWGLVPQVATKLLVVVDDEVDVRDPDEVLSCIGNHVHPARDVFSQDGSAGVGEHASPLPGVGQRLGIDATKKLPAEHARPWPRPARATDEIAEMVERRWKEYGLPPSDTSTD